MSSKAKMLELLAEAIEAAEEGPAASTEPGYGYWHAARIVRGLKDGLTPGEVDQAIIAEAAERRAAWLAEGHGDAAKDDERRSGR
jgi:hypothetical protein